MADGTHAAESVNTDLIKALNDYQWAVIEAKNILRCISIACDHGEAVAEDLRPAIGVAVDGVNRLLGLVQEKWNGVTDVAQREADHG